MRRGEFLICPAVISADMLFLPDWEGRMFTPVLPHFSEVFSPALSLAIQKCLIILFRIYRHHSIQDVALLIKKTQVVLHILELFSPALPYCLNSTVPLSSPNILPCIFSYRNFSSHRSV